MKKNEVVWPIRMSIELKNEFKKYCDKHGYSMNKLIKLLIIDKINYNEKEL